ncbi:MAG: hypothetical protein KDB03_15840 [Planctomycetales bacterium]|nr:hypothetical protein [Planctomycetales bacterium]
MSVATRAILFGCYLIPCVLLENSKLPAQDLPDSASKQRQVLAQLVSSQSLSEGAIPKAQHVADEVPIMRVAEVLLLQSQDARQSGTESSEIRPLTSNIVVANLSMSGETPKTAWEDRSNGPVSLPTGHSRGATPHSVNWQASNVFHYPLFFEDAMLERHGHVRWGCAQPIFSGVRFFGTIPLYPYLKTLQPECCPRYALGHFRAGSCAPVLRDNLPYDSRAIVTEALAKATLFWAGPF